MSFSMGAEAAYVLDFRRVAQEGPALRKHHAVVACIHPGDVRFDLL